MSGSYFLSCIDCSMSILLGRPTSVKYQEFPQQKFGFAMLGSGRSGWEPFDRGVADLQQFLVIHRGHELRVIPDTIGEMESNADNLDGYETDQQDRLLSRMAFFQNDDAVLDAQADKYGVPATALEKFAANIPPFVDPEGSASSQPTEASPQQNPAKPMVKG